MKTTLVKTTILAMALVTTAACSKFEATPEAPPADTTPATTEGEVDTKAVEDKPLVQLISYKDSDAIEYNMAKIFEGADAVILTTEKLGTAQEEDDATATKGDYSYSIRDYCVDAYCKEVVVIASSEELKQGGLVRKAMLLKNENGQLVVVQVEDNTKFTRPADAHESLLAAYEAAQQAQTDTAQNAQTGEPVVAEETASAEASAPATAVAAPAAAPTIPARYKHRFGGGR